MPFLRSSPTRGVSSVAPNQTIRSAAAYEHAVATASRWRLGAARIPVEQIAAPVLFTSGDADGTWPSTAQAQRALESITKAGNPHGSALLTFPGAGHLVGGVPDLPTTRTAISYGSVAVEAGGDPATTAAAVRSTFSATVELLRKAMPRGGG
jgi:hypothetical protein